MTPRFTVVVPAYNVENEIEKTIKSLTDCLTDEFELIVVNDESTDDTPARIDKALLDAKCPARRVDIPHAGLSAVRNEGLRLAKGEYIAFIDGDDMVTSDYADKLLEFTRERKPDAVFFGTQCDFRSFRIVQQPVLGITGLDAIELCFNTSEVNLRNNAAVFKREFLEREQLVYTPGCRMNEDVEFITKTLILARSVDIHLDKLYIYIWRETSITGTYKISWFDGVDAILRAIDYAIGKGVPKRTKETIAMLVVYMFLVLRARVLRTGRIGLRELNNEVEKNYPGQTKKVIDCARKHLPVFHIYRLALLAYRACPPAFFPLMRIVFPKILV